MNYQNFMNSEYGMNLDWDTGVDAVAATSLGVHGWALCDVGSSDVNEGEITLYRHNDDLAIIDDEPVPPWARPELESENELSDLDPLIDETSEGDPWTEVSNALRGWREISRVDISSAPVPTTET